MSKDLDAKLREIQKDALTSFVNPYSMLPDILDSSIAQIHAAFSEAGYRYVPKQADIQHLIDDGTMSPLMTGQAFYDRFETELNKKLPQRFPEYFDALEAARRAANLDTKEETV